MKLQFEVKILLAIRAKFFRNLENLENFEKSENLRVLSGASSPSSPGGHQVDGVPRVLHP